MVRKRGIFGDFLGPVFPASRVQHISDLHSKFALQGHTMCRSMVDIQSATAEIRGGKNKKELECGPLPNVMAALPYIGGVLRSTRQTLADPVAGMLCSNATNIEERNTWTHMAKFRQGVRAPESVYTLSGALTP